MSGMKMIVRTVDPPHAKSLGLKVSQFGEKIWLEQRLNVAPWHKFKSDELARLLIDRKILSPSMTQFLD